MEKDQETVVDSTETNELEPQGTTEAQATGSTDVEESENNDIKSTSLEELQAQLESERKERQKIEMERNQLKNKQEEERKARLEEEGNYKALAEEAQRKLEEKEAEEEARKNFEEANRMREAFIDEYPNETVKKAVKAAIERNPLNFVWESDVATEEDAKAQLFKQMDGMAEALGVLEDKDTDKNEETTDDYVHPNNPLSTEDNSEMAKLKNMSAKELREILPRSESRQ